MTPRDSTDPEPGQARQNQRSDPVTRDTDPRLRDKDLSPHDRDDRPIRSLDESRYVSAPSTAARTSDRRGESGPWPATAHAPRPSGARPSQTWEPDPLLTPDQVAAWIGKPKATLYAWRSRGLGPRAIRVGNALRYRRSEVERWLDDHTDPQR